MRWNVCGGSSCPCDPILGQSTLNIGTITGGRAPNVIPDHASAEIFIRLVGMAPPRAAMSEAVDGLAEATEISSIPALHLSAVDGLETTVVSFTTDIPAFGDAWGNRSCWDRAASISLTRMKKESPSGN